MTLDAHVAALLRAPDPVAALHARLAGPLDTPTRAALAQIQPDGLRVAALLVVRLRFERLMQGDVEALGWFEQDPVSFTEAFRRYHHAVPATSLWPWDEAAQWAAWRATEERC